MNGTACTWDAASTAADKRRIYLEMLEKEGMQPIREVVEFVHSLGDAPKAIATGSAMPGASRTLAAAGLSGLFDVILTPDEVEHGKPAPDMFLKAAELLGVSPDRCVVFEDAEPGMKAAAAAGMDCVQVRRPIPGLIPLSGFGTEGDSGIFLLSPCPSSF